MWCGQAHSSTPPLMRARSLSTIQRKSMNRWNRVFGGHEADGCQGPYISGGLGELEMPTWHFKFSGKGDVAVVPDPPPQVPACRGLGPILTVDAFCPEHLAS